MTEQELIQKIRLYLNLFQTGTWDASLIPGHTPSVQRDLDVACEATGTMTDEEVLNALFNDLETGEPVEDCSSKTELESALNLTEPDEERMAGEFLELVLTNFNLTGLTW